LTLAKGRERIVKGGGKVINPPPSGIGDQQKVIDKNRHAGKTL